MVGVLLRNSEWPGSSDERCCISSSSRSVKTSLRTNCCTVPLYPNVQRDTTPMQSFRVMLITRHTYRSCIRNLRGVIVCTASTHLDHVSIGFCLPRFSVSCFLSSVCCLLLGPFTQTTSQVQSQTQRDPWYG
jgi:hypothetical protein